MATYPEIGTFPHVTKEELIAMEAKLVDDEYNNILNMIAALYKDRSKKPNPEAKASDKDDSPTIPGTSQLLGKPGSRGMKYWMEELGYTEEQIKKLNVIHVGGTNGKTIAATFSEGLLRARVERNKLQVTTGLYTSPHVSCIEERYRINGKPLSKSEFARYAREVFAKLRIAAKEPSERPGSMQFLTLLSFHVFIKNGVNAAIYECHTGGQFDPTNVIADPVVTAITQISKDDAELLGPDFYKIAWHHAGIIKSGAFAISSEQNELAVSTTLRARADEKKVTLEVVPKNTDLRKYTKTDSDAELENLSLAYKICEKFLEIQSGSLAGNGPKLSEEDLKAVSQVDLPGRSEKVALGEGGFYFLDVANGPCSIDVSARSFFKEDGSKPGDRVLVFGHAANKDHELLLETFVKKGPDSDETFDHVLFATAPNELRSTPEAQKVINEHLKRRWEIHFPNTKSVEVVNSLTDALEAVKKLANEGGNPHTLIIGTPKFVDEARALTKSEDTPELVLAPEIDEPENTFGFRTTT